MNRWVKWGILDIYAIYSRSFFVILGGPRTTKTMVQISLCMGSPFNIVGLPLYRTLYLLILNSLHLTIHKWSWFDPFSERVWKISRGLDIVYRYNTILDQLSYNIMSSTSMYRLSVLHIALWSTNSCLDITMNHHMWHMLTPTWNIFHKIMKSLCFFTSFI